LRRRKKEKKKRKKEEEEEERTNQTMSHGMIAFDQPKVRVHMT
jgi:hypothetical protein